MTVRIDYTVAQEFAAKHRIPFNEMCAAVRACVERATMEIDFKQATELLDLFGGAPQSMTLAVGDGWSGQGTYASATEYPEDGAYFLGVADGEATPPAAAPQQAESAETVDALLLQDALSVMESADTTAETRLMMRQHHDLVMRLRRVLSARAAAAESATVTKHTKP